MKARFFSFTLNNYDEAELVSLRTMLSQKNKVRYAIFGREIGKENGTPHLQGYVAFIKQTSLLAVKKVVGLRAHVEVSKGTQEQNIAYCSKEDPDPEVFGSPCVKGQRSDLRALMNTIKVDGVTDMKKLREEFPDVVSKYPRFVNDYIRDCLPEPPIDAHPLRVWQQDLNDRLKHPADARTIEFLVDSDGNAGKSWFAKYYCSLHSDAVILRPTKHADMAYAIPPVCRVLFLDCTRKQVEFMPYTFMEECKDGMIFSSKYESCVKKYPNMHVVVMMNQDPDRTALSADRYAVTRLS